MSFNYNSTIRALAQYASPESNDQRTIGNVEAQKADFTADVAKYGEYELSDCNMSLFFESEEDDSMIEWRLMEDYDGSVVYVRHDHDNDTFRKYVKVVTS